jgi:signal transduction histidine kinase
MAAPLHPALKAVSDAVLAVGSQHAVEDVLQRLVHSARELAGARYAALGIPDEAGGFRRFLVSGMSDELIARLGPLPRKHGVLGAMLESPEPVRTRDLHEHPRFGGWWPDGHPDMRSFLGVPIVAPGEGVIGAFYLTHKEGATTFGDDDQEVIELLAAHAALAITNARLYERSRELSMMSERNRLALELHDAVSQKLFGLTLAAESASTLLDRPGGADAAREQVVRLGGLAREALDELRALIQELRPPDLERDGLCGALRKQVESLARLHDAQITLHTDDGATAGGADGTRDADVLRVAQEALANALRHGRGRTLVAVRLAARDGGGLVLDVRDDGAGFDPSDPELRSRHLGLTSMETRAARVGGTLTIRSAPGTGTTVRLEVPAP